MKFEASAFSYYGVMALTASPGELPSASEGRAVLWEIASSYGRLPPCLQPALFIYFLTFALKWIVCTKNCTNHKDMYLCERSQTEHAGADSPIRDRTALAPQDPPPPPHALSG